MKKILKILHKYRIVLYILIFFIKTDLILLNGNSNSLIICFIISIILIFIIIIYLLNIRKYINVPNINVKIIYNRIWPSVNVIIVYSNTKPVKIQNKISSIYIKIFGILKAFLVILNISNKNPTTNPHIANDNNCVANSVHIHSVQFAIII